MRSGIDWNSEGGYQDSTHSTVALENSEAWIQFVLDRPMDADPGTVFEYNDGVTVLLGKIVGVATGKRIDQWAEERLFAPIGIDTYYWKITPDGEADSMGGLYLTAHDLARIGYLFLREGIWRDERVLSEGWVRQSITSHVADIAPENHEENTGYGYQWWLPERKVGEPMAYLAGGFGGQRLTVIPELDLVVVFHGWDIRADYGVAERTFRQEVLPAALMQ
jgi:CubicO group peptidase (beta-lactamase class C family)